MELDEQCIHGMTFEYCGLCQKRTYITEVKFPIEVKDDETGKPKQIWLKREVERVYYKRYR